MNTRIAPSPTGNAHIGLVRTAYLNYLAARSTGGAFYVRIDDTDAVRSDSKYTDDILATFDWLGLDYDGVVHQSDRFGLYTKIANDLVKNGLAKVKDGATYINLDGDYLNSWSDLVVGTIDINDKLKKSIDATVLMRSDGTPTYHFASCVDDIDMDIDLIIRGTDHIDNAAIHSHIFNIISGKDILFAHVGLIFHNGKKISKRDMISDMDYYKANYNPKAVLNGVLKLGWSHPDPNIDKTMPLIDTTDAIHLFNDGNLRAAKSSLDLNKLDWLNKRYGNRNTNIVGA
jgi:glutamyl-tRNA synthetase